MWKWVFGEAYEPPAKDSPLFTRVLVGGNLKQNMSCRVDVAVANTEFNVTPIKKKVSPPSDALESLQVPVHVMHGALDTVCSYAQTKAVVELLNAESMTAKPIKLHTFSAGHMPLFQCKDEFIDMFVQVVKEINDEQKK